MTTLAYRKRRCRAKLRRRARDRSVALRNGRCRCRHVASDPGLRAIVADGGGAWWSTPEGRARWTENDRARKRETRAAARMIGARIVGRDFLITTGQDPLATLLGAP